MDTKHSLSFTSHPRRSSFLSPSSSNGLHTTGSHPGRMQPRRRSYLSFLVPRSKIRCLFVLITLFTTVVVVGLSFSIFTFDIPPLNEYDVEQTPRVNISRSFEEPDFALLSGAQPHTIGCPQKDSSSAPLLLLGIFSAPDDPAGEDTKRLNRRNLIRRKVMPDWPAQVELRFILGRPKTAAIRRMLSAEQELFGDIAIVDGVEDVDFGKTHAFFKWVAQKRVGENPKFVMKIDDDTFLVMPNAIASFEALDCSKNIYWGTSAGMSYHFGFYLRGLGYAVSWPLASWIGSADISTAHICKYEDARTGQWLRNLDPVTDPIHVVDNGWTMGDYNQLDVGVESVALHWLKFDGWYEEQVDRVKEIWSKAGRQWAADGGVDPKQSIDFGKKLPSAAQAEKDRQKSLGWDV